MGGVWFLPPYGKALFDDESTFVYFQTMQCSKFVPLMRRKNINSLVSVLPMCVDPDIVGTYTILDMNLASSSPIAPGTA